MALSENLVSQFAKTVVQKEEPKEATINGVFKVINGKEYVKLDGSNIYTPVESTIVAEDDDKVKVLIKEHSATIIGNITSPSARSKDVNTLKDELDEYGNVIKQMDNSITQQGNSIVQIDNTINQHSSTLNQYDTIINQHGDRINSIDNTIIAQGNAIEANNNSIIAQGNVIDIMNNTITSQGNTITSMNNTIDQQNNRITQNSNTITQQGNTITQQGNTITEQNSKITVLNSAFSIVDGVITGLSGAIVNDLKSTYLDTVYADIDFANINMAAVEKLFTDSGIIKDLVVQSGAITGELVGVTIKGDLIEANSLKADKLVVKGEDGLYYKLNIDGLDHINVSNNDKFILTTSEPTDWEEHYKDYYIISNSEYIHVTGNTAPTWASNTYYKLTSDHQSGLDGTAIIAQSVTADKIQVTDLVAFGATIGGFVIGSNSLHTVNKSTIGSSSAGLYLGADGQINIGDSDNFIIYYKDNNNDWKLRVSTDEMIFGGSSLGDIIDDIRDETTVNLEIESSNGLSFKNNNVSTVLSVIIYRGFDRITDIQTLRQKMGDTVYLQWKWKRITDSDYRIISSSDPRISENGFKLTITDQDVDDTTTFICELNT